MITSQSMPAGGVAEVGDSEAEIWDHRLRRDVNRMSRMTAQRPLEAGDLPLAAFNERRQVVYDLFT
jgi:hypothetical protein